ncbi:MAG: hypothetical protein A2X05_02510 [Bacteroidetes bacterium GWE2_41_25]|nr:MAG: hypothetical protein A2X03_08580 [Bacteroidetes bacterium GWA2_40_15]OFX99672.1 MAG: hypothetical protein A2X06_00985 [Bacteroidetes bacterium GWC2_40_22]OFY12253.1 MAG: hypothetical protein A2X05_02510 [Bacteroidetes bacterium GWE2_41_25]OFY60671.1 MAG: hypothetical protein A2X04_13120 [Bacteroidetes bacterium GWF2_41_9]HAM09893.1 aminotransferase class IV [Bacteroidales bacterium]
MDVCFGKNFILNGTLQPSDVFDNSMIYEGDSVYEVIRMVKGSPVFFQDHLVRLEKSVKIQGREMLAGFEDLRRDIIRLSVQESLGEVNLKIVFNYNNGSFNYLLYFIEPIYPTQDQYNNGVKGILFKAERSDPASKVINPGLRSDIFHKLILEGAYEALLVDNKNYITEGSRSNIFFLREGSLYTAPEDLILSGITRKYIIEICRENNIEVVFKCVRADEIGEFESVFMSGTSPVVLPFSQINDVNFNVRLPVMGKLRQLYIDKAENSIMRFLSG